MRDKILTDLALHIATGEIFWFLNALECTDESLINVAIPGLDGLTPMFLLVINNCLNIIQGIDSKSIKTISEINIPNKTFEITFSNTDGCGHNLLYYALACGHKQVFQWLWLRQGIKLAKQNKPEALAFAFIESIEQKEELDAALYWAAMYGLLELIDYLIVDHGAELRSAYAQAAITALRYKHFAVFERLIATEQISQHKLNELLTNINRFDVGIKTKAKQLILNYNLERSRASSKLAGVGTSRSGLLPTERFFNPRVAGPTSLPCPDKNSFFGAGSATPDRRETIEPFFRGPMVYSSSFRRADVAVSDGAIQEEFAIKLLACLRRKSTPALNRLLFESSYKDVAKLLNTVNIMNVTPLSYAIESENTAEEIGLLLSAGAKANRANDNGTKPLYFAAIRGDADIFYKLIKAHCDLTCLSEMNINNRTCIDSALKNGKGPMLDTVAEMLKSPAADTFKAIVAAAKVKRQMKNNRVKY